MKTSAIIYNAMSLARYLREGIIEGRGSPLLLMAGGGNVGPLIEADACNIQSEYAFGFFSATVCGINGDMMDVAVRADSVVAIEWLPER